MPAPIFRDQLIFCKLLLHTLNIGAWLIYLIHCHYDLNARRFLADKMKIVPSVIVKKLFMQGKIVTVNQEIDYETAEEIALEFDILCEKGPRP